MDIIDAEFRVIRKPLLVIDRVAIVVYVILTFPVCAILLVRGADVWEFFDVLIVFGQWVGAIWLFARLIRWTIRTTVR